MPVVWLEAEGPVWVPTEDDLPYSDGRKVESERQAIQIGLLSRAAKWHFRSRDDVYVAADMFIYFSLAETTTEDFRGPDLFVVTGTTKRERKSWLTWQEGKGPEVVIEILSESTRRTDMTIKKEVYATRLRVPEYFWYDPFTGERAGFVLNGGDYLPIDPDQYDGLPAQTINLTLVRWRGAVEGLDATWLRWATADGVLLPTPEEEERKRADAERERAERAEREMNDQQRRIAELEARLAEHERRSDDAPDPA